MVEKDYKHLVGDIKRISLTFSPSAANPLYGTKILNLKTQEIRLLICLWENRFADKTVEFATCGDRNGKRYNIEHDNIRGFEDDFEKETLNITLLEFKIHFAEEIRTAFESYKRT